LAFAGSAQAAHKQLWYEDYYNGIASNLAGYPIVADGEDDLGEWGRFVYPNDPEAVLGFTFIDVTPEDPRYRHIFLAPSVWSTLVAIEQQGLANVSAPDAAEALMTLIHESYHQRLDSSDEGYVNACALRDFPAVIETQFGVPATVEQTTFVDHTVYTSVKRTVRVRVRGRWVKRTITTRAPSIVSEAVEEQTANPAHDGLVAAAQTFYSQQPYPYNAGTC
jgi:hypothetical protein